MTNENIQKPVLAWFILIGGGLFALSTFPGMLLMMLIPFWKPDELSFMTIIFMTIAVCIVVTTIWAMKRAFQSIRNYNLAKKVTDETIYINTSSQDQDEPFIENNKKPIWPWVVIIPGAVLLISTGPAVIMFPIMPLFLAGMSTDSGSTPDYIPFLIIIIGYGLMIGYTILVIMAIKALRKASKTA
ncbi:hypothetical protein JOC85_003115 [Bacillus mesophilus]|uniref:Uncharacterized protein n=1 Tax=Bacillus mesophilus TaxID=1808955 RepID=A0A6M0QC10_9BACI|nr:hypothetical protein [Bacillus mesophilus]MBM7662308.1 hypothetical protein [Bacillus mesophilus]NEY73060.1 hypothetical protein [Bacillus mesophilus]